MQKCQPWATTRYKKPTQMRTTVVWCLKLKQRRNTEDISVGHCQKDLTNPGRQKRLMSEPMERLSNSFWHQIVYCPRQFFIVPGLWDIVWRPWRTTGVRSGYRQGTSLFWDVKGEGGVNTISCETREKGVKRNTSMSLLLIKGHAYISMDFLRITLFSFVHFIFS